MPLLEGGEGFNPSKSPEINTGFSPGVKRE
jgi:hypothetical protein